ncbi:hypothetical protein K440DRAFT_642737 [Wilcoxina mikolae CBS 423.85]|nr:hypothetical protein K440DRAFT_642737 [Wilcoxina mikolae CBS 423.85]
MSRLENHGSSNSEEFADWDVTSLANRLSVRCNHSQPLSRLILLPQPPQRASQKKHATQQFKLDINVESNRVEESGKIHSSLPRFRNISSRPGPMYHGSRLYQVFLMTEAQMTNTRRTTWIHKVVVAGDGITGAVVESISHHHWEEAHFGAYLKPEESAFGKPLGSHEKHTCKEIFGMEGSAFGKRTSELQEGAGKAQTDWREYMEEFQQTPYTLLHT